MKWLDLQITFRKEKNVSTVILSRAGWVVLNLQFKQNIKGWKNMFVLPTKYWEELTSFVLENHYLITCWSLTKPWFDLFNKNWSDILRDISSTLRHFPYLFALSVWECRAAEYFKQMTGYGINYRGLTPDMAKDILIRYYV